ncbi:hypothetical protein GCM10025858_17680 [Alicyclobacillus sacchari]|uniref:protease pro-enzyme activation domain-containing protein n=1 Tax=Alicyclobacillus sacchari TaxID=392010 RepID=UPI0023E9F404|nr:protease pro-enzyme activation domain-containing protein [Alicyclobacillus sacchari]GMA57265.1 hypothetical protein GCM10025858_17680 [Alicyclobacillus sacchari]
MGFWKHIAVGLPAAIGLLAWQVPGVDAASVQADTVQNPNTQNAQDLGPASAGETITASLILKVQNEQGLENYIQQTETPGNPNYHKFLTTSQFAAEYAPSQQVIQQIVGDIHQLGLQVDQVDADGLDIQVSGTVAQFDNALNTTIDNFRADGHEFRAPKHVPHIPNVLLNSVLAVVGLDTEQAAQSLTVKSPNVNGASSPQVVLPKSGSTATNTPGSYTVGDTANMYDINPLYQKGITGKGETVGIVTLSDFNPSDAYAYWSGIGLKTPRIEFAKYRSTVVAKSMLVRMKRRSMSSRLVGSHQTPISSCTMRQTRTLVSSMRFIKPCPTTWPIRCP